MTVLATGIQRHRIAPPELQRFLREEGGRNPHGEPNFRLVWGASRLTWRSGEFTDRDPETGALIRTVVEAREVPKYGYAMERWHIESWHPPEWYGDPDDWPRQWVGGKACETLGEFPTRGGYESIYVCEALERCSCRKNMPGCPDCKNPRRAVPFDPTRADLEYFIRSYRIIEARTKAQIEAQLREQREQEKKDSVDAYFEEMSALNRPFNHNEYVSYAGLQVPRSALPAGESAPKEEAPN